jgi:hypothetical protein
VAEHAATYAGPEDRLPFAAVFETLKDMANQSFEGLDVIEQRFKFGPVYNRRAAREEVET